MYRVLVKNPSFKQEVDTAYWDRVLGAKTLASRKEIKPLFGKIVIFAVIKPQSWNKKYILNLNKTCEKILQLTLMKSSEPNKRLFLKNYVFLSRNFHKTYHFPLFTNCNKWTEKNEPN